MAKAEARQESLALVAALFEQHHGAIFAYLYRLVDDREWACDLTQDTFLQLLHHREQLDRVANQRAWLYRVATNLALNGLKRRRRFAWLAWRSTDNPTLSEPGPVAEIAQRAVVEQALNTLPASYSAPLLLYSHYGFSVREVATILNLSQGAVKNRLYRAREMFRRAYESENDQ
ncbi:MAG: RNA polymerase sigma factor [Chloroflexi bacterium]|nr:RNA polymerase sigma factor [Chloroflexota bacterium]MCI0574834.1 RNA polymerase sigma factor [Chloroflexota bacterium]MCI0645948.1 RNA polymerase sigma factor [Chloroflexota bacterium]MCI0727609.1 RNA polymerase sigma factor [Chloroflexota bacterium]